MLVRQVVMQNVIIQFIGTKVKKFKKVYVDNLFCVLSNASSSRMLNFFLCKKMPICKAKIILKKQIVAFLLHVTMGFNVVLKHVLQGSQILLLS
jgi:hypothetical protein